MRYFLSRSNRLYHFLIHQKVIVLYLLTILGYTLITSIWYFGCYRFIQKKTASLEKESNYFQSLILKKDSLINNCQKAQSAAHFLKKELPSYTHGKINENYFFYIQKTTNDVAIKLSNCSLLSKKETDKNSKVKINVAATVMLEDLLHLFNAIVLKKIPLTCKNINIESQAQSNSVFYDMQSTFCLYQKK